MRGLRGSAVEGDVGGEGEAASGDALPSALWWFWEAIGICSRYSALS